MIVHACYISLSSLGAGPYETHLTEEDVPSCPSKSDIGVTDDARLVVMYSALMYATGDPDGGVLCHFIILFSHTHFLSLFCARICYPPYG